MSTKKTVPVKKKAVSKPEKKVVAVVKKTPVRQPAKLLLSELSLMIEQSQRQAFSAASSLLVVMFWQVGKRINEHILQNKRDDYGKEIVVTLSRQLQLKYGNNFEEKIGGACFNLL